MTPEEEAMSGSRREFWGLMIFYALIFGLVIFAAVSDLSHDL